MAKFKVGDKVEDFQRYGIGKVYKHIDGRVAVEFQNGNSPDTYMSDGRYFDFSETPSLRLTGRPFNVGDKVVIGGEKGVVHCNSHQNTKTSVSVLVGGKEHVYITTDGRAWPGTPIIAEHDWEEESHDSDAIEYRERNKGVDVSPGFAKDWPIDNGIEDVTVSPEEVRHIAEMQDIDELEYRKMMEVDALKDQHNYARMALSLTGFKLDKEAAALITETVKRVLELGGEFSLDTACEVETRVNEMYEN